MTQLDRLLFSSYIRAYMICLFSLLSLYIIVDLFTNLDDFSEGSVGLLGLLHRIGMYYGYRVLQIFDRLCEAMVLLAAMFTIAWLQRSNELVPMLSAGVSTNRVLRPVYLGSILFLTLGMLNQELVIPRIAAALHRDRADPDDDKMRNVEGVFDTNGVHVEGMAAEPKNLLVYHFDCVIPETLAGGLVHLHAREGRYVPPQPGEPISGGWMLIGTTPAEVDTSNYSDVLQLLDPGRYFLKVREADFAAMVRNRNWFVYASTLELRELLDKSNNQRLAAMAVLYHTRLTRPILGLLLVTLGLAIILRDQNRHVFISAGLCLAMCAMFYGAVLACKYMGESDFLSPALAAWLPVLIFGPLAFALYDAIHT